MLGLIILGNPQKLVPSSRYTLANTDGFVGVRLLLSGQYILTNTNNKADNNIKEEI